AIDRSAPPTARASAATPSATSWLCETRTSPTTALRSSGPGREGPDQEISVRERHQTEHGEPAVDPSVQTRSGIEVEEDAPETQHRVDRDEQQEQGLDREDHRVRDVREHLAVVAETADRLHHEM